MRKAILFIMLGVATLAAPLVLTGCNTVEGAGEDLQEASEATEEAIEDAVD